MPPGRRRRVLAGVLVAVSCLSLLAATVGVWANRNLLDTDVWVDRAESMVDDPAVRDALARRLTDELMTLVDVQELFDRALPERGQVLAVPLSGAVEGWVRDQVDRFLAGDAFERLWVEANRAAHRAAVTALRGDSEVVTATEDGVTLDLRPVVARVRDRLSTVAPGIVAEHAELRPDAGLITVYGPGTLHELQRAVALFDRIVWVSVALFAVSTVAALVVSPRRRRTVLRLAVGQAAVLLSVRAVAGRAEAHVLDLASIEDRAAARAATSALLSGLFDGTRILLWILVAVAAVALLSSRPVLDAARRAAVER